MFAVINIPNFALQSLLRHKPDLRAKPVALVDSDVAKDGILQMNAIARKAGIAQGLKPTQGLARCSNLIIKGRSLQQEKSSTELLLQIAYAFSPSIENTSPGCCTMGLQGLGLNNESTARQWGSNIVTALRNLNLAARIGFGPTPDLAFLAVCASPGTEADDSVYYIRDVESFMAELPVEALDVPSDVLEILRNWGIPTVGKLIALGKDRLAERLGAIALKLFARVSIQAMRPLKLVSPPEHFVEEIYFEGEVETAEPLLVALQNFAEQLSRRLELLHLIVGQFNLQLGLASGAFYRKTLHIPAATGNVKTLVRALRTHLETLRTDSPVTSVRLEALPANPRAYQFELFENVLPDPNQFGETLARLSALCGSEWVGSPLLQPTYRPDSFEMADPDFDSRFSRQPRPRPTQGLQLRRFRPAVAAEIEFNADRPAAVRSHVFTGSVAESRGPYLLSGNWWDDERWAREEWDIQASDGGLYRIFRSESGAFVEGIYD